MRIDTPAYRRLTGLLLLYLYTFTGHAQVLTLRQALETAVANYPSIKAKGQYLRASQQTVAQAKAEALPNAVLSAQQDYGTVNGQNGPLYGLGGFGVSSSGIPLPNQSWSAAFGALYLANVNWDFFAFGRLRQRIRSAETAVQRDRLDQAQEIFQHKVRVAGAYLNLLAAQRLRRSQERNLQRADTLRGVVLRRAQNGLIAGVDSSQANAEVSGARLGLIRSTDWENEKANDLAYLMGQPVPGGGFVLDTVFITRVPGMAEAGAATEHPLLSFYKSRVQVSDRQAAYLNTFKYPTFSAFGIVQTRGSGFKPAYNSDQTAYTKDYLEGIKPTRTNYLLGIGVTWNLTALLRYKHQVAAQQAVSAALQHEYEQMQLQLQTQSDLADRKLHNAYAAFNEAPVQVKAASDAFLQRSVLYRNGLTNIVDVAQTLYVLTRAETDRDIAYNNVWQALLLKAAAAGDFNVFEQALP
jgi:outer membrane protein TolC